MSQDRILDALEQAKYLTISQVAELFYAIKRDGQPAKSFRLRPRANSTYELIGGYGPAIKILNRMANDDYKLLSVHKSGNLNKPFLYSLRGDKTPAAWNHVMDTGDLFVAYFKSGRLIRWAADWEKEAWNAFARDMRINPDGRLELQGLNQVVMFEVDMGTEKPAVLKRKVEKYLRLAQVTTPFVVVFTFQHNKGRSNLARRQAQTMKMLEEFKRGKQFLVASHDALVEDPFGPHLVTPTGQILSVQDL